MPSARYGTRSVPTTSCAVHALRHPAVRLLLSSCYNNCKDYSSHIVRREARWAICNYLCDRCLRRLFSENRCLARLVHYNSIDLTDKLSEASARPL